MTAASVLRQARDLITPKGKWTQEAVARDARGNEVRPADDRAVSFDMIGAIQKVPSSAEEYGAAILLLRAQCDGKSIFDFNDAHGKKFILALMDKAAEAAEQVAA
jgi:hypothetical protein